MGWYYGEGGKPVDNGMGFGGAWDPTQKLPPGWEYGPGGVPRESQSHKNAVATDQAQRNSDSMLLGRNTGMAQPAWEIGNEGEARDRQAQALNLLRAQALGQGPSAAAVQQQQGTGQALRQQMLMGGGGNPLAQRAAMLGGQQGLQQAYMQGAQGRTNEQLGGLQNYGQGATALRGGDQDLQGEWLKQTARDRALQLQNAQQNSTAVRGWESLAADKQARLRNSNLTDWQQFNKNQANADASSSADEAQMLSMMMAAMAMMSDERQKTKIRKGGR